MTPHDYPTRVLVAVTGLSPQIVTETLFALAVGHRDQYIVPSPEQRLLEPTKIRLITTEEGARRTKCALLHPERGWFYRLCSDYDLPVIEFGPEHIIVLRDEAGRPLDDIRSREDNRSAADAITAVVRELSNDQQSALHVSIAGGRKTMGFYLGYALSLFGRAQDRLSHVLVNAPFESHPEFFYPTPKMYLIKDRNGRSCDARDARVTLADIPFVRLRDELRPDLLTGDVSFSVAVEEAQRAVPPVELILDPARCTVTAGGASFELKPSRFALYWLLADRARGGRPGVHWSEEDFVETLLRYYRRIGRVDSDFGDYKRVEPAYRRGPIEKIVKPTKTRINNGLRLRLGERRATPYLIDSLGLIPGTRRKRFGLSLPPSAIRYRTDRQPARVMDRRSSNR